MIKVYCTVQTTVLLLRRQISKQNEIELQLTYLLTYLLHGAESFLRS